MKSNYLILIFLISFRLSAQDSTAIKYGNTILAADLERHLVELASDKYEGRETGRKGQKMAGEYISNYFKSIHLQPGNNGSYYQEFPLILQHSGGTECSINDKKFDFLEDFYFYRGFSDTSFTSSNVVFVGYGIDDKKYSDYKKVDVKGKIVMVLAGEPYKKGKSVISKGKSPSAWSVNWRMKQAKAKEKGAKAILLIPKDIQKNVETMLHYIESPSMMLDLGTSEKSNRIPNFYISSEMANELLKGTGNTVASLKKSIVKKSVSVVCKSAFKIDMKRKTENLTAENVLGFIEGTDKKEEIVILTAHYDHIGIDEKGVVFNGADDDGSGTVALLELAQAFQKAKEEGNGPRRSILIMPVAGEEKGLLGSDYYSKNPIYPLEKTVVDLNIDMIGRMDTAHANNPDYVYIIGSTMLSSELHAVSEATNKKYTNIQLDYTYNSKDDPNRYYYRSDHYNFAKNDIPVIFYFNGVHADYHKQTDTVEKIHFGKIEKITKLVFYTAWEIANRDGRLKLDKEKQEK